MKLFPFLSSADTNRILKEALSFLKGPELLSAVLCVAGLLILIGWIIRHQGRDPLAGCRVRRSRMPVWLVPMLILLWLLGSSLLYELIKRAFINKPNWQLELAVTLAGSIWYLLLLTLFLAVGYFTFARRLKGFGLRWKTAFGDAVFSTVTLIGVWPMIYAAFILTFAVGRLFFGPDFDMQVHSTLLALNEYPQWWMRAVLIFNAVLLVPVFEEVLFRGLLQSALTARLRRPWIAIAMTSALFAGFHPLPTHWLALFTLSLGLGYSYEKSGSLLRPIFMHILFNGISVSMTLLDYRV